MLCDADARFLAVGETRTVSFDMGELAKRQRTGMTVAGLDPLAGDGQRGAAARQKIGQQIGLPWLEMLLDHQGRRVAALLRPVRLADMKAHLRHVRTRKAIHRRDDAPRRRGASRNARPL